MTAFDPSSLLAKHGERQATSLFLCMLHMTLL